MSNGHAEAPPIFLTTRPDLLERNRALLTPPGSLDARPRTLGAHKRASDFLDEVKSGEIPA
jgi:hypothetical protein